MKQIIFLITGAFLFFTSAKSMDAENAILRAELADKKAQIAQMQAEIAYLRELNERLSRPAARGELAKLREQAAFQKRLEDTAYMRPSPNPWDENKK